MDERRFRLDFVIALCAVLISTVAAVATVYQTRIIGRQFSAAVWPYVSFDLTNSPDSAELDIRNDGLGPAIIRSVKLTWNGKPQASIETLVARLQRAHPATVKVVPARLRAGAPLTLTTSTPTAGMVVPANSSHTVIRMEGAPLVRRFGPQLQRLRISLCYCSLTGDCWTQTDEGAGLPHGVRSCA